MACRCSTAPTSIPTGSPRRSSARPSRASATGCCISTKATFPTGDGPNDFGSSRQHLVEAVDGSLQRLGTTTSTCFQLHGQDYNTPVEETLATLDQLVRAGKVRYIGCSNFSGWHLMKSLAASDRYGYPRYVAHQAYYSLLNRDYEWELMPLGHRSGRRRGHLEPARLGQADRQDPPRPAGQAGHARPRHRRHRPAFRGGAALPHRRRARRRSPPRPARPSRRSRSTGCCSGRPSPTSSSARATRSSSSRTSAPSAGA